MGAARWIWTTSNASCSLLVTRGIDRSPSVKGKSDIQAGEKRFSSNVGGRKNREKKRNILSIFPFPFFPSLPLYAHIFDGKSLMRNSMTATARAAVNVVQCISGISVLYISGGLYIGPAPFFSLTAPPLFISTNFVCFIFALLCLQFSDY